MVFGSWHLFGFSSSEVKEKAITVYQIHWLHFEYSPSFKCEQHVLSLLSKGIHSGLQTGKHIYKRAAFKKKRKEKKEWENKISKSTWNQSILPAGVQGFTEVFLSQVLKELTQKYSAFAAIGVKILWCMDPSEFFNR